MPWKESSAMSLRQEFVQLADREGVRFRDLCRRFGVSFKTGYKWLSRYNEDGVAALGDRSRRPKNCPRRTADCIEERVVRLRQEHASWGGRKLRARLQALGESPVPAASTITQILRRHGLVDPQESSKHQRWQRFEHAAPNDLWQMDFKGHFATEAQRCHPLTVLDDHSRYSIGLRACRDERRSTVQTELTDLFRRYGLPRQILADNGPPWGCQVQGEHTGLTVWLMRLGIRVTHGRPYHPQTQGKDERFHRTLVAEVLRYGRFRDTSDCQSRFDAWREIYNWQRPHEALGMGVPGNRYHPSTRSYPESAPPIEYGPADVVRTVRDGGRLCYQGQTIRVGKAFTGYPVAVRPVLPEGVVEVAFCQSVIGRWDLKASAAEPVPVETVHS